MVAQYQRLYYLEYFCHWKVYEENLTKRRPTIVLWIQWVHNVYIQDRYWWGYQAASSASWVWKTVCKVKKMFRATYDVNNNWRDGTKSYSTKDGYLWLKGQFEKVG